MALKGRSLAVFLVIFAALVLTAEAATETVLHSFAPYLHGFEPTALVADAAGNFYVSAGGGRFGRGLVLKFTPKAKGGVAESVLYTFKSGTDGSGPIGLFLDSSGNLFGLTVRGACRAPAHSLS